MKYIVITEKSETGYTLLDADANGQICGITIEHAGERAGIPTFSFEQSAASEPA